MLENLSRYGGTVVGKGAFIGGTEIKPGTSIDVISQKTGDQTIQADYADVLKGSKPEYGKTEFLKEMSELPRVELSQKVQDGIISTEKGKRFLPSRYLSQQEIDAHLKMFDDGVVKVMSRESYKYGVKNYGETIGPKDGQFVMPKFVYDKAVAASEGNPRVLEELLALNPGDLGESPIVIEANPQNIRIPSGNEPGAWQGLWEPGGYTQGGVPEAVIDQLQPGDYLVDGVYN